MDLGPTWTDGDAFIDRSDTLDCGKCLDSLLIILGSNFLSHISATVTPIEIENPKAPKSIKLIRKPSKWPNCASIFITHKWSPGLILKIGVENSANCALMGSEKMSGCVYEEIIFIQWLMFALLAGTYVWP
jgi:hypothetical protein